MTKLALYQLAHQHRSLLQLQEADELPADMIRDTLEGIEGDIQTKAVAVAHVILNLQAAGDAILKAAERQKRRGDMLVKRSEQLKQYLLLNLQAVDIKKIHHEDFDIRRQANAPSVEIDDATQIPEEYMRAPPPPPKAPDKITIAAAFKSGLEVPGAHAVQGEHVRIVV